MEAEPISIFHSKNHLVNQRIEEGLSEWSTNLSNMSSPEVQAMLRVGYKAYTDRREDIHRWYSQGHLDLEQVEIVIGTALTIWEYAIEECSRLVAPSTNVSQVA